ncbi:ATP-binding protein [Aureimonas fodinaquatilis]|uniref:ATP-binding protein n=1 Tax=Aureimonas fodinaquatilis TaxID=2565783 RepID=A0A5B0DZJ8_9HYPH|nr:ATP-binding protein [Aureimonas fodinaquatilis]KAA0972224.1 ATP-binding protein [Aureimonas fodinaquatilis]
MKVAVDLGTTATGEPAEMDLEELLSTRLLVQGNSGSGKSHLFRRILEQSSEWVQQAIIDPEGDFVSFSERFGHIVVDADRTPSELARIAARIRQHRASVVLNLEGLDAEVQMNCAAAFLNGLFDADRNFWFPMLIAVDEAQIFAPAIAGEVGDEARRISLGAMTNLMCRGRKRGLAGMIATQRLAKLAKNVAAEASNFLMGRTFLDIDMARAADLLGMERRQAERFRDLEPGQFVALGPALSRRPVPVRIGPVETAGRSGRPVLMARPETPREAMEDLIFTPAAGEAAILPAPVRREPAVATRDLLEQLAVPRRETFAEAAEPEPEQDPAERQAILDGIYDSLLADPEAAFRPVPVLYQDFLVHCRLQRISGGQTDMLSFRRRLALTRAGVNDDTEDDEWQEVIARSEQLPEDMQGVYMMLARAAREGEPCPNDEVLAKAYGSHSPSRGRFLLTYMADRGFISCETDFRGQRVVMIAGSDWRTGAGQAKAGAPGMASRLRRA